jgi:GxxExxY protein
MNRNREEKGKIGLVVDPTGNTLTYQIIGCAMDVHNRIGAGFKEEIYEKALFNECERRGLPVQRQIPVEVVDLDESVGIFYLDMLVSEQVVVEVKAFSHQLTNDELAQVLNYLKATGHGVGLLFNFGRRKLEYRRIFPPVNDKGPIQRVGRDSVLKSDLPDLQEQVMK